VAALLEIEPLLDRLPRQLSGGQRQRVAMGRALVREPAASLLDEPLSNLDPRLRVQVRADIQALQARTGTTMLYVTHDQVEAMTLGHRVAVMDRGRVQQVATPRELYAAPANVMVAGFVGNPPMNLLPARFVPGPALVLGGRSVPLPNAPAGAGEGWTLGLRPEALQVVTQPEAPGAIPARIAHLEHLGHETLVHLHLADDESTALVARVAGMPDLSTGQTVGLVVDPAQIALFDADGRLAR
jgi:ABC-type sugar transport system ATPase subunit